ncbi:hypothetical protein PFICI_13461 [Pestalotiopsis fici W106-1]|uniref:Uncharacterized protein n=1 Tax=Pestalotiopsis fici (strain W106-1 / CGMCC3.15140) TaxID=1229662 RepID=W3WPA9_PESFW|nr:uncharacterized protein PFICI_13461 [Pestalotiopsis fici W106-1]ETS74977.1 hypothetical protein PFICI_13461 [Pestalotiopsis fici W106-1]
MTKYARQLGFNIAGLLGFGYDLGLQTEKTNRSMLTMLDAGTAWSNMSLQYPSLPGFRAALILIKTFRKFHWPYLAIIEKMIRLRTGMAKGAKHDLYSVVANSFNDQSDSGIRDSKLWG